jgi:OmpA-OmpF porin, OOP family
MKKSSLSLLFIFASFISFSQIRVALVGGGHQATVKETNTIPGWDTTTGKYYDGRIGIHTGFIADIPFSPKSKLYFQPGAIFYMRGRKYSKTFNPPVATVINEKSTQYVNYIDIPLSIVLKFGKKTKFILGGGPFGSFFFNGKETSQTNPANTEY